MGAGAVCSPSPGHQDCPETDWSLAGISTIHRPHMLDGIIKLALKHVKLPFSAAEQSKGDFYIANFWPVKNHQNNRLNVHIKTSPTVFPYSTHKKLHSMLEIELILGLIIGSSIHRSLYNPIRCLD